MKRRKLRLILVSLISMAPTSKFRYFLYRSILSYKIHKSIMGLRTVIDVSNANLNEGSIGVENRFIGPLNIAFKKNSSIGSSDIFNCGCWTHRKEI